MLKFLKNLFKKEETGDPTAKNCEVFLHRETAELIVINADGKIEGDLDLLTTADIQTHRYDIEDNLITVYLNRDKVEYLGDL